MKKYIFFTCAIQPMGGAQNYVRSKIRYLKARGWKTYIIYSGTQKDKCQFQELNDYIEGGFPILYKNPCDIYGSLEFYIALYKMLGYVEYDKTKECEYWIESHHDYDSIWAEILSRILKAKHLCLLTQENYFAKGMHYQEYIKYFDFKLERNELFGISPHSIHNLFLEYKNIEISDKYKFGAYAYENVADITCKMIENLPECDYTIGYMGRCEKDYFPLIVDGVGNFANKYSVKSILFLVMGSAGERELTILDELKKFNNIIVKYLGVFNPIPKVFFNKIDVMVAGSGCARISYLQNVMTIIPHALKLQPIGILGYTTQETLYGETNGQYVDWFESILINKKYLNCPRKTLFSDYNVDGAFETLDEKINKNNFHREYFNFNFKLHEESMRNSIYFSVVNDFLNVLSQDDEIRKLFYEYIKNLGFNQIGLYGFGKIGKRLKDVLAEIEFKYIFDVSKGEDNSNIVYPNKKLLNEIDLLVLSPIGLDDEIKISLSKLNFGGEIISFYQCSLEFMKCYFSKYFYTN